MDYNYNEPGLDITMKEIYSMIEEMEKERVPIIRKTPKEISDNTNSIDREKELVEFTHLHDLYVAPLLEIAKLTCMQLGIAYSEIPGFSNLSIMGRVSKLCDFLISKGCTVDTIRKLLRDIPKEIQELLLEKENLKTPLTRKTPSMIMGNSNIKLREEEMREFQYLHDLYVVPLLEFSIRVCMKYKITFPEIPNFSELSLMGRVSKLRNFLISKGCTMDTIKQLIPQSIEEIELLRKANINGFNLGFENIPVVTNENRLERAKRFLAAKNEINTEVHNNGKKL